MGRKCPMNVVRSISPHRPFYGWTLVGVAAFVMVIGTVPLFQGMTAWFVVLESHFGWSRTQLSIAFSLSRVEGFHYGPHQRLPYRQAGLPAGWFSSAS